MQIVMITCARDPAYLDATLDSLFASDATIDKIRLLVHETSVDCIARWINDPRVDWRKLLPEEHDAKMRLARRTRVCHAMRLALEDVEGDCIFLEDDAVFSQDWLQTFNGELVAHPAHASIVISLRTHLRWQKDGFVRWDPKSYYGTVAVYFDDVARRKTIEALRQAETQNPPTPGIGSDVALQRMLLRDRSVTLYARFPNLIEHTGKVSSIASEAVRQRQADAPSRGERAPVSWPEKQSRPEAPTPSVTHPVGGVTTKPRKNPNPPVKWGKRS